MTVQPAKMATLHIQVKPPVAFNIELDGKSMGTGLTSPLELKTPPGVHLVRVTSAGYHPIEVRKSVESEELVIVGLSLQRISGLGLIHRTIWEFVQTNLQMAWMKLCWTFCPGFFF